MKVLETIISTTEIKRRTNIRTNIHHKAKRRNELGLTKRQQEKKYKEEKVKELIQQGFNKSQIAKELDLNRSTITRSYSHLFS